MRPEERAPVLRREDLMGAWESVAIAGSPDPNRQVIVFKPYGREVMVEYWLGTGRDSAGSVSRTRSLKGACTDVPFGLRFSLRDNQGGQVLYVRQAEEGTIVVTDPFSAAGGLHCRRTTAPSKPS
jgi:hypothetical protein